MGAVGGGPEGLGAGAAEYWLGNWIKDKTQTLTTMTTTTTTTTSSSFYLKTKQTKKGEFCVFSA